MSRFSVALYWPNILCYARIALAFAGLGNASSKPIFAVAIWITSAVLDLFDGMIARMLNQTSKLGVILDIIADNVLRTSVWIAVAIVTESTYLQLLALTIVCTEWITMLMTQLHSVQSGEHWKKARSNDPWFVCSYFENNFRNPLGTLGIFGLFSTNLFIFGAHFPVIYSRIPGFNLYLSVSCLGRLISFGVELWLSIGYLSFVLDQDARSE